MIAFEIDELAKLGTLPRSMGCDFCAGGAREYRYPARSVGLGALIVGQHVYRPVSVGHWAACQDCADLIDGGDWPALARRSLRSSGLDLSRARPGTRVRMLAVLHSAQECFRQARTGPREAVA